MRFWFDRAAAQCNVACGWTEPWGFSLRLRKRNVLRMLDHHCGFESFPYRTVDVTKGGSKLHEAPF